jgi:hypothetical protein
VRLPFAHFIPSMAAVASRVSAELFRLVTESGDALVTEAGDYLIGN